MKRLRDKVGVRKGYLLIMHGPGELDSESERIEFRPLFLGFNLIEEATRLLVDVRSDSER